MIAGRPVAMGLHGAASTPHLLASQVALDVLREGGNAVDAGVAAAAAATVVQPFSSSIGGVGWATVHLRRERSTKVLDFHGTVPLAAEPAGFHPDANGLIDLDASERDGGALRSSLTPQVAAGWEVLARDAGTWTLAELLEPAARLATEGFPVSPLLHRHLTASAGRLARWPASATIFLPNGRPPTPGERFVQTDLGATLRRIGAHGGEEATTGFTGRALAGLYDRYGGWVAPEDLAGSGPRWSAPASVSYRGFLVCAAPAPLGDVAFLEHLSLLEGLGPFDGPTDAAYVHHCVEAAKLVAEDRKRHLGEGADPDVVGRLLESSHLDGLRASIGPTAARIGVPARLGEDTITLAVVDEEGNAVHLMQTVGDVFGTGAVVPGTGVMTNSSLRFSYLDHDGANRIVPGGRVEQNPCTSVVFAPSGLPMLVVGSPGGKSRVQTVRQMVANVLDFGMGLQEAVDAPRFLAAPDGATVQLEAPFAALAPDLAPALRERGHRVETIDHPLGSGQAVGIDPDTGTRSAAADHRMESVALAY